MPWTSNERLAADLRIGIGILFTVKTREAVKVFSAMAPSQLTLVHEVVYKV